MAGATYVLDKTYKIVNSNGVGKYRAVAPTANPGECNLPSGVGVVTWGITQEAQARQNENVTVRKLGISRFVGKGTINPGDFLEVASSAGDLQRVDLTQSGNPFIVGVSESALTNDGDTGFVFLTNAIGAKSA
jgi:hypothetical protein